MEKKKSKKKTVHKTGKKTTTRKKTKVSGKDITVEKQPVLEKEPLLKEKRKRGRPKKIKEVPVSEQVSVVEPSVEVKTEKQVEYKEPEVVSPPPPQEVVEIKKPEVILPKIKINELTTVREISEKISVPATEVIKKLLSMGVVATINQRLEQDVASLILHEFGYEAEFVSIYREEEIEKYEEDIKKLKPRAPVVTVMGHVDHGKTTLLDTIRQSNITSLEHGGITQHIGAYKVKTPKGEIVFLDTPGHEAFTAMRAHGAKVTDIVVIVVAADDGVMPQTIEAIDHARAAGVPIIVAINKIDLPNANPQGVKQQLSSLNLIPDEWGGQTLTVEISARNNINIDKLLETILFKAELLELKANPDRPAQGVIIECKLDSKRGPIATVLIQNGTLRVGNYFICGVVYGKVRAMFDDTGKRIDSAGPSTPVEILGFSELPHVGEKFIVVKDDEIAKEIVEKRKSHLQREKVIQRKRITLEDLKSRNIKQLNIILKTDVFGSLEAIKDALERHSHEEIKLNIVHAGVGAISESDVNLAITTNSIIVGFNVHIDQKAEEVAKSEGVDIRIYKIIYELLSDIKKAQEGLLEPKIVEVLIGRAQVKKTFNIEKVGTVAGCLITQGKVQKDAKVKLIRNNAVVYEGNIASLKRFKDDVKEVEKGYECGISIENFNDIKVNDILEFYKLERETKSQ
ncbi:MAG: translation initiation factor IF-2 [Endomicrobiia bacterium]